ncbi:unnamed protein product [Brassicogethes aeneus]|uniref:Uncharacterized protein n=1 Tax=Brassicogethes aeneus TaxID=1431903 RepID=A0A9P0FMY3_BRAAE|nr:unnamed protein product [Brassicogethes aeneus]
MGDVAARREARRRRILENSDNRLNKILGVEEKSEISIDGLSLKNNVNTLKDAFSAPFENNVEISLNNSQCKEKSTKQETEDLEKPDFAHYLINFRVHVILCMAVTYCILLHFLNAVTAKELCLNKMFTPLLVYEVVFAFFTPPPSISNIQMMVMFAGVRGNSYLGHYFNFMARLMKLIKDVALYFVFFITSHYLINIF